ncbi:chloride channel protein [Porcipelethomonas sp.]|uniref:chloride channel protein n=1 Tax=Porcipelethomonas sp. TaxID=2981675 RepID=UPI003EF69B5F
MKKIILRILKNIKDWLPETFGSFFKWIILSLITGTAVGIVSAAFHICLEESAKIRTEHPVIILLLPIAGLLIVGIYRLLKLTHDKGTNMVLVAVRDGENMTWRNTLSIFTGSVLTHLTGGSAGREGAALQIGGSIGSQLGLWLKLKEQDHRLITMCGMSAGFSALFGTPAAAAFFSMEVISVGIMHYSAIVPCIIAALTGFKISSYFGVAPMAVSIKPDEITGMVFIKASVIAVLCGLLSIVFCFVLKNAGRVYKYFIRNPYLRIFIGGMIVTVLTFICHTYDYNGAGGEVIVRAFNDPAPFYQFILKLIFTALTLGAGFKGGEILPAFFVGSTFGSFLAPLLGIDCSLGAAIGLSCLFCGVTNCPVTAVFLCAELFGVKYLPVYLLTCGISYMLSGYAGLYSEQKILDSKLEPKFIDKKVGKK